MSCLSDNTPHRSDSPRPSFPLTLPPWQHCQEVRILYHVANVPHRFIGWGVASLLFSKAY